MNSIGRVNQMSGADLLSPYNDLAKFTVEKRRPLLASLLYAICHAICPLRYAYISMCCV